MPSVAHWYIPFNPQATYLVLEVLGQGAARGQTELQVCHEALGFIHLIRMACIHLHACMHGSYVMNESR